MGRTAQNIIKANDQAIRKRIRLAKGVPQKEWRIGDVRGLVLITQPSGSASYYVYYRNRQGKNRKLKLGNAEHLSLHEARKRSIEELAAVGRGEDPVAEAAERKTAVTFRELAERFFDENSRIAPSTKDAYRGYFEKDVYAAIGNMPACDVTKDDVVAICKSIEKRDVAVQSERTKAAIGGVYRWAERERYVDASPSKGIGRRSPKVARTRTPSTDELATLWDAVEKTAKLSRSMQLIIKLTILTGQRRTEVAGARVSELDVSAENPSWTIPGDENKRGRIIRGRTKNGREQTVPLSTQAAELFRQALLECANDEFVFPANFKTVKVGKTPRTMHINGHSVSTAMRRIREGAGIEDISIHDMRRAIANWLKDQGVSREVRDLILNHKDQSVTEEHYSSTARMERQVKAALQAWADHVCEITGQAEVSTNKVVPLARELADAR